MRVLTIKSNQTLSEEMQNEIHHSFGMEHHTDYVFTTKAESFYTATISLDNTEKVISLIINQSKRFSDLSFSIDDLNLNDNVIERYKIQNGEIKEHLKSNK